MQKEKGKKEKLGEANSQFAKLCLFWVFDSRPHILYFGTIDILGRYR